MGATRNTDPAMLLWLIMSENPRSYMLSDFKELQKAQGLP